MRQKGRPHPLATGRWGRGSFAAGQRREGSDAAGPTRKPPSVTDGSCQLGACRVSRMHSDMMSHGRSHLCAKATSRVPDPRVSIISLGRPPLGAIFGTRQAYHHPHRHHVTQLTHNTHAQPGTATRAPRYQGTKKVVQYVHTDADPSGFNDSRAGFRRRRHWNRRRTLGVVCRYDGSCQQGRVSLDWASSPPDIASGFPVAGGLDIAPML